MASVPSNYSISQTSRGTLVSELGIVVERTINEFIDQFGWVPYVMWNQFAGNDMETANKLFYWYEAKGRAMGFVVANASVSGANGAAVVVTIKSGYYSESGTRSLPNEGLIFYNARTGVESRVSATNKTVDNAHTFTLVPVRSDQAASVLANDEIQCRGYKYVGEASDYTGTIIRDIVKYTNYATQHRIDSKFTDLSLAERIDFEIDGQPLYKYKQMKDDNMRFRQEKELRLMDSELTDNLGYTESGSAGTIQQVTANGITEYYNTFNVQTTFAGIERKLDAEGGPMAYDWLCDTDQDIEIQLALGNEFNNGAMVFQQDTLRRGFKTYEPMLRKFSWTRYTPFSERKFYGSSAVGTTRNNFGLLIPKGKGSDAVTSQIVPQFCERYQLIDGKRLIMNEVGGLSANGKTTKNDLTVYQQEYSGIQLFGANQYLILTKP